MIIGFPDEGPDDIAILKPSIPILSSDALDDQDDEKVDCIFHGHLRDENNVAVSLSGCPKSDTFEV